MQKKWPTSQKPESLTWETTTELAATAITMAATCVPVIPAGDQACGGGQCLGWRILGDTKDSSDPKPIDAWFLSLTKREIIRDLAAACSFNERNRPGAGPFPSTVSRELARNTDSLGYLPYGHTGKPFSGGHVPGNKLANESELRDYVMDKLLIRWSP